MDLNYTPNVDMHRRPSISSLSSHSNVSYSTPSSTRLASRHFNLNQQQIDPWIEQQSNPMLGDNQMINQQIIQQQQQQISQSMNQGLNQPLSHQQQSQQQQNSHQQANQDIQSTQPSDNDNDNEHENENDNENDNDELIPTAIVIKNIPFAIKKEQLLDVMTKLNLPLPYAFNYHFDNGVFRGLAFANFTSTDETCLVVNQLNGREIGGRKLRVEYKKMLPLQERERIEREKREKRGQLEEQHRSNSLNSLNSLISINSNTSGIQPPQSAQSAQSQSQTQTPISNLINLQSQIDANEKSYINLPISNLLQLPKNVDFNDPETLEIYSILYLFSKKIDLTNELVFTNISINSKFKISSLSQLLNLIETYENGFIIVKRNLSNLKSKSTSTLPLSNTRFKQNSSSPLNLQQPLPINRSFINQSLQLQSPMSYHQQQLQQQQQQQQQMQHLQMQQQVQQQSQQQTQQQAHAQALQAQAQQVSSAALLRGNRSFVDIRNNMNINLSGMYNNGSNLNLGLNSQPSTPINDLNSRFFGNSTNAPTINHNSSQINLNNLNNFNSGSNLMGDNSTNNTGFQNLTSSNNNINLSVGGNTEFFDRNNNNSSIISSASSNSNSNNSNDDRLSESMVGLSLNLNNDNNSGIWGPK